MNYDPLNKYLAKRVRKIYPKTFNKVFGAYQEKYGRGAVGKLATAMTGIRSLRARNLSWKRFSEVLIGNT